MITHGLILSPSKPHPEEARSAVSKDGATFSAFFNILLYEPALMDRRADEG
jgi:hypothetical protein